MKIQDAITAQINRMTEEDEVQAPASSEMTHILQAFISLINAYLKRTGGEPEPRKPQYTDVIAST